MIWAVSAWVIGAALLGALITNGIYRMVGKYGRVGTAIIVALSVIGIALHFI